MRRYRVLPSIVLGAVLAGCGDSSPERSGGTAGLGEYDYRKHAVSLRCDPGARIGGAGRSNDERSLKGIRFSVRTPANYDPRVGHPLLMVYAPAGRSRFATEQFTGLTSEATREGFVVAYADSRPMAVKTVLELGTIPALIARKWCVDEKRVYLTGHSDGGTVATALALLEKTRHIPAGIAPSAAGFAAADFKEFKCPAPLPVVVMHGARDRLFPGWGAQTVKWWAACNRCDPQPGSRAGNGCVMYSHCAAETLYCEGEGAHAEWPRMNAVMLGVFRNPD